MEEYHNMNSEEKCIDRPRVRSIKEEKQQEEDSIDDESIASSLIITSISNESTLPQAEHIGEEVVFNNDQLQTSSSIASAPISFDHLLNKANNEIEEGDNFASDNNIVSDDFIITQQNDTQPLIYNNSLDDTNNEGQPPANQIIIRDLSKFYLPLSRLRELHEELYNRQCEYYDKSEALFNCIFNEAKGSTDYTAQHTNGNKRPIEAVESGPNKRSNKTKIRKPTSSSSSTDQAFLTMSSSRSSSSIRKPEPVSSIQLAQRVSSRPSTFKTHRLLVHNAAAYDEVEAWGDAYGAGDNYAEPTTTHYSKASSSSSRVNAKPVHSSTTTTTTTSSSTSTRTKATSASSRSQRDRHIPRDICGEDVTAVAPGRGRVSAWKQEVKPIIDNTDLLNKTPAELYSAYKRQGYLYIRGALSRDDIIQANQDLTLCLIAGKLVDEGDRVTALSEYGWTIQADDGSVIKGPAVESMNREMWKGLCNHPSMQVTSTSQCMYMYFYVSNLFISYTTRHCIYHRGCWMPRLWRMWWEGWRQARVQ